MRRSRSDVNNIRSGLAERHEKALERREMRAERRAALYQARHQIVLAFPAQNQVVGPATSADSSPAMPAAASSSGVASNTAVPSGSASSSAAGIKFGDRP